MNTTTPNRRRLVLTLIVASFVFSLISMNVPARDTDIYFTDPSASGLKPNVLLIIDTSGSMNEEIPDQTICPGTAIMSDCLTYLTTGSMSGVSWPVKCNGAANQASCDYSTHKDR